MSNGYVVDAVTRHQIYLQRYAGGQVKELLVYLKNLVQDISRELSSAGTLVEAQRLTVKLQAVESLIGEAIDNMGGDLLSNLDELVDFEAGFASRVLTTASTIGATLPANEALRAIVTNSPMTLLSGKVEQVLSIPEAIAKFSDNKKKEVRQVIQEGVLGGKTSQDMARDIDRLVGKRGGRQAEALIRTSVNHISTTTNSAVYRASGVEREEWVSVLDNRTSITCARLDGEVFDINQGPPCPRHWNCRSNRIPYIPPEDRLIRDGTRSALGGEVSAERTYSGWLRDQSNDFQNEVLGKTRADLFRNKQLSLSHFADNTGRVYTLKDLERLEPSIFE